MMTALIVDDENLARQDLRDILSEFPQIEIIGEAENLQQARALLKSKKPQIIFLDIQMPGENGFDLLQMVPAETAVIFVTAYDQYAIRAFEVNALDYLMKPVSRDRLAAALERVEAIPAENITEPRPLSITDSVFLRRENGYAFIQVSRLICIEAHADYSVLLLDDGQRIMVHKTLQEWEARLPQQNFCRIHRSTIINIGFVEKVDDWYNRGHLVTLHGVKKPLAMSRRYFTQLRKKLG